MDADSVGDEVWGRDWESGNNGNNQNLGNNCPEAAQEAEKTSAVESTEVFTG
jgi:hypothetical protein